MEENMEIEVAGPINPAVAVVPINLNVPLLVTQAVFLMYDEARSDFEEHFDAFSKLFKLAVSRGGFGVHLPRLERLLLFESTIPRNRFQRSSLYAYIKKRAKRLELDDSFDRYPHTLNCIYFLPAREGLHVPGDWLRSPLIERFVEEQIEVVYLRDRLDLYCMSRCADLGRSKLIDVTGYVLKRFGSGYEHQLMQLEFYDLCRWLKELLLVDRVVLSERLVDSAVCYLEIAGKSVFEINPSHSVIKELKSRLYLGKSIQMSAQFLYDTGRLAAGFDIEDTRRFAAVVHRMILAVLTDGDESRSYANLLGATSFLATYLPSLVEF